MLVRVARGSCSHGVIPFWRRSARRVVGALLLASLPIAGCVEKGTLSPPFEATATLNPAKPAVGPAVLTVSVRSLSGAPVKDAVVRVEGQMTHAGMTPIVANGTQRVPGDYDVPLAFSMAGDWVLLVKASVAEQGSVEFRIDVPKVGAK